MVKIIKKLLKYYLIIFIIIFLVSNVFFGILNKKAMPVIISYAQVEAKKSAIDVLRSTGLKKINELVDEKDLYKEVRNENGEIESIDFNISTLNNALIIVAKSVREKLRQVEQKNDNVIYKIPVGVASNNAFFYTTGPKIPVKVEYKGNVGLDLKTNVKPYGIDSALIEIYVRIETTQRVTIPFQSKDTKVTAEIPIVIKVIKGASNGVLVNKSTSYSLPIN